MFCLYFDCTPIPVTLETVCLYAQFLARSFVSVEAIRSYLSGVKQLHLFAGAQYPHTGAFALKLTLRGLEKLFQHRPQRAAAITPELLLELHKLLNLSKPHHAVMWCLFLFAFFLMARSSNLVPKSAASFDAQKQLLRRDIFCLDNLLLVALKWSKTNQVGSRVVQVPLLPLAAHPLCPISAFTRMCELVPAPGEAPAFCLRRGTKFRPVTYLEFQTFLKNLIKASGRNPAIFSSHSFRRGGATWAFKSQVPSDLIQVHGDWASDAYKIYLECDLQQRARVAQLMCDGIQKVCK